MQDRLHKTFFFHRSFTKFHKYACASMMLFSITVQLSAGLFYDNRYFPLTLFPYVSHMDHIRYARIGTFITTASSSFEREDKEAGTFDIFGAYDQKQLALSMEKAGLGNPFVDAGQIDLFTAYSDIRWNMQGKIQSQGAFFGTQYGFNEYIALGFEWYVMRVNSRIDFYLDEMREQAQELDTIRRSMNDQLGLLSQHVEEAGMGDLDLYLRLSNNWDYSLKFRHIDVALRLGLLVPTGKRRVLCEPASVPFGGNGHYGFYLLGETELELKEDWKFGMLIGLSKRFKKTQQYRIPIGNESPLFAPVLGDLEVNPGPTFMMAPYFSVENLRKGLGARIQYTLAVHGEDEIEDARNNRCIPAKLKQMVSYSSWGGGHITLTGFYDFGKMSVSRGLEPVVSLSWDIPVTMFTCERIVKTNKVTIGVEFNF